MAQYSQSHRRWIAGLCLTSLLALPLGVLSVRTYQNEVALRSSSAYACAQITGGRLEDSRDTQVRYTFTVGDERYSFGDATGRSDLWATLPDDAYELSAAQGCVEVVYSQDEPSINRPRDQVDSAQHIGGFVLTVLILLLTGSGLFGVIANARTTLWTLVSWNDTELVLRHDQDELRVLRTSLKKAVLRMSPIAMATPAWRFSVDVLVLKTNQGKLTVAQGSAAWASLLTSLEKRPGLRRQNAA